MKFTLLAHNLLTKIVYDKIITLARSLLCVCAYRVRFSLSTAVHRRFSPARPLLNAATANITLPLLLRSAVALSFFSFCCPSPGDYVAKRMYVNARVHFACPMNAQ